MKKTILSMFLLLFVLTLFSAINVAVSIVPQKTFVEAVGKDLVNVTVIIPPGYSPSNYAPTARQIVDFSKSSVYFTIGVPAEQSNILPKIAKNAPNVEIVHLEEEVDSVYEPRFFGSGGRDLHIWLSPKRAIVMIESIRDHFCSIDAQHCNDYRQNANEYVNEIKQLDEELRENLSRVKNSGFFCYHPSFGYFADDYSLTMYALEENGKEATPKKITEMIELAKKNDYKVIFYQAEIDSSQTESFAHEIGGKALQLDPLSHDYLNNLKEMGQIFLEVLGE
ncbi:MAG: zinc ABC transporter substrate-binding protein [Thermotogota bacterium]|nr:zinc ABC transporter substrate-binding protein [Thermotogota bacterium]